MSKDWKMHQRLQQIRRNVALVRRAQEAGHDTVPKVATTEHTGSGDVMDALVEHSYHWALHSTPSDAWMRDNFSRLHDAFLAEQFAEMELFIQKHRKYGYDNITGGEDLDMTQTENIRGAMEGIYIRMRDKMARLKRLIDTFEGSVDNDTDESLVDTLRDLSNYANISIVVARGKWLKH
jgi:hypothetical protein